MYIGIEDPKFSDDAAAFIREKVVVYPVFCGELPQDVLPVVADGEYLNVALLEGLQVALQLNELRPAKWSPGGAPVKKHESLTPASCLRKADEVSALVG